MQRSYASWSTITLSTKYMSFPCWKTLISQVYLSCLENILTLLENRVTRSRKFLPISPANRSFPCVRGKTRGDSWFARRAWSTSGTQKSIVCRKVKDWRLIEVEAFLFSYLPRTFWLKRTRAGLCAGKDFPRIRCSTGY